MEQHLYDLRYQVDREDWRARAKRDLVFLLWRRYAARPSHNGVTTLDLGCGTGILQEQFARRFHAEAFGIDTSSHALAYCRRRGLTRPRR